MQHPRLLVARWRPRPFASAVAESRPRSRRRLDAKPADGIPGHGGGPAAHGEGAALLLFLQDPADFGKDTQGLTWEDGSDLPSYADPARQKRGHADHSRNRFPRNVQVVWAGLERPFPLTSRLRLPGDREGLSRETRADRSGARQLVGVDSATKTVYFRLDPDARWSDGVPFTTDDIVFSWYLFRSPLLDDPWMNDYFIKTFTAHDLRRAHVLRDAQGLRPDIVARVGDPDAAMPPCPEALLQGLRPGLGCRNTTGASCPRPGPTRSARRTSSGPRPSP
jgi:hypothetical protein